MEELLSHEIAAYRAVRAVSLPPGGLRDLWRIVMCPDERYIQVVSAVSRYLVVFASSFFPNLSPVHRGCATKGILWTLRSQ